MSKLVSWLIGLVSVMITSAAGGVTVVIVDPAAFNLQAGLHNLLTVCGVMALTHGAMYLQQSPLAKLFEADPTKPAPPAK